MVVHCRNFVGSQLPDASEVLQCTTLLQNIDSKTPLLWKRSSQEIALESASFLTVEQLLCHQEFFCGGCDHWGAFKRKVHRNNV